MGPAGSLAARLAAGRRHAGARDPFSRRAPSPTRPAASRSSMASISRSPPERRSPSSARTARARRRSRSSSAACTTRRRAPSRSTASTCATLDIEAWRSRVTAVFQDFIRFELPLRDNVAPAGAPDDVDPGRARRCGRVGALRARHHPRAGYEGGTELSGGQWQRVALARALVRRAAGRRAWCSSMSPRRSSTSAARPRSSNASSPPRGTRTTILISHRFSTVRHADRICVLEGGRVVELGTHDELMAAGGRYRTMFDLQASRFGSDGEAKRKG